MHIKSYEYRIYPSKRQAARMSEMLGDFCDLYNAALEERIGAYKKAGETLSYYAQCLSLTECRKEIPEIGQWSASAEQQVLRRLNNAYAAFFRRVKSGEKAGFPRFRSKARYNSATFKVGDGLNIAKDGRLKIRGVKNSTKVKWHRELPSKPKSCVLINRSGKWFVSFYVEVETLTDTRKPRVIGIDVGLSSFIATSDGHTEETPQFYKDSQKKRRRLQRSISRKKRGSASRRKAVQAYAKHSRHVTNQRKDHAHRVSYNLVKNYTHIALEDLNIKGLVRGMLSKSVHNAAWGQLIHMITYKAECAGSVVEKVDPRGTSQICTCGAEVRKTLRDRKHTCNECGLVEDRDVVSAQVILQRSTFGPVRSVVRKARPSRSMLASEAVGFG